MVVMAAVGRRYAS